jgi:hypothetical protein
LDRKTQKTVKIVLYISLLTALTGGIVTSMLFKGPMVIGAFFGMILGFFLPWVVALISYSIYMMSNPAAAFKDEIDRLHKK